MYEYACRIVAAHDGDTVTAEIDLGFEIRITHPVRLFGINAPELATDAGKASLAHLLSILGPLPAPLTIRTVKDRTEKYGRYLGTFLLPEGGTLNDRMVADGFAVPYSGGPRT